MAKKRPNILLIMSDQHRMDCLGTYGNQEIQTDHIDQLAGDGVVFENSFCAAPSCTPSRYSLMTGLYPHQHQGYTNYSTIPAGTDTFPRILRENGYHTKVVGKIHVTPTYLDVGFDEMELAEQTPPGRFEDDYHWYLKENNLIDKVDVMDQVQEYRDQASPRYWETYGAMESNLPEEHYSTTWIAEKALESIDQWQGDANFLKVSFIKPHHPFDPPAPWSHMYDPSTLSLLPGWTDRCLERDLETHRGYFPHDNLTEDVLKQVMAYYYATISHIDFHIGRIVNHLKQKNMYDDTLIVYTSDHGEYMGFHHLLLKSNNMYDPLVKVPLIIKYPQQRYKGTRSNALVSNIDLAPTVLDEANCDRGRFMDGNHITDANGERKFVFTEDGRGKQYMVRSKTYKLLWSQEPSKRMFFDLEQDPLEFTNVYDQPEYQHRIEEHKDALFHMVLFEHASPVHVDEHAACVKEKKDGQAFQHWIRGKMNAAETNGKQ